MARLRRLPALLLLWAALFAPSGPLFAQDELGQDYDLDARLLEMENTLLRLESRIQALQGRFDAVLGSAPAEQIYEIPLEPSPVRGNPTADITLVMFGDYQSDYSARAHFAVKRLLEDYPGQIRFVYKHYPLTQRHPQASDAALTALSVERQGLFWELHDLLFVNSRRLDPSLYLLLAEQAGVDLTRFEAERRSLWALERLVGDEKLAARLGIKGVPTLFLNGRKLPTWRYDYLKDQIDKLRQR